MDKFQQRKFIRFNMKKKGYKSEKLPFTRKMVIASIASNKKNAIHCMTQIDVTEARKKIKKHFTDTGTKLSFTGYIVKCFAETITHFPEMNSFIRNNRLIVLDDVTIGVLVEREIDGNKVPEPVPIKNADRKSLDEITDEIRTAKAKEGNKIGDLDNTRWINLIPGFLLKTFVRIADRNIGMAKRYGKLAVTSVGMFSDTPLWFIPHGTATVLFTVGSIEKKEEKEFLCLTVSFDHEIIDGSPATRFMNTLNTIFNSNTYIINS